MKLSPEIVEAAYELLRRTAPFKRWRLPDPDDVVFRVMHYQDVRGDYNFIGGYHQISVSVHGVGSFTNLIHLVAHEMIHLHQNVRKTDTAAQHNAEFHRLNRRMCKLLQFDDRLFV